MTHAIETVNDFMQALEAKEFTRAGGYLSDSLIFTGFTPVPLHKNQFISVMSGLAEGFPNLSYTLHGVEEVAETMGGSRVKGAVQINGSQVNSFQLPALGIGPIPQTARSILLPEENWDYQIENNLIASIQVDHMPGGGVEGLLNQLGIHDPINQ